MARLIPALDPRDIALLPERLVAERLATLPDDYVVMHSLPWLRPSRDERGQPLREGEADFVVLHPRRGLLVIEVKGGEVALDDRVWVRKVAGGTKDIRDPFQQGRRNLHALVGAIEEGTVPRLTSSQLTYGYAVAFPQQRYEGALPPDADPRIVLDGRRMGEVERWIEGAFAAYGAGRTSLDAAQVKQILGVLAPKLHLTRHVGSDIASDEARLVQLTELQQQVLVGLLSAPRVLVEGVAGSGKTLLALEVAVQSAEAGRRVLYLCFNKHLAAWARERIEQEPRLSGADGRVVADHFHARARALVGAAGVELEKGEDDPGYWNEEVPSAALQAIDLLRADGDEPGFDEIVVDEGQDFLTDWWDVVLELLRDRDGPIRVLRDRDQALRVAGDAALPWLGAPLLLDTNCRNTARVARPAAALLGGRARLLPGTPEGEEPRLVRVANGGEGRRVVEDEVTKLLRVEALRPAQIALLGPKRWENGGLGGVSRIAGVRLTADPAAWRRGEGVLCSTARAFKGLEADAVIVYDLAGLSEGFSERDLYVAWTRARHRLTLVCQGDEARVAVERALARGRVG